MITSRSFRLKTRNISDRSRSENQNTHLMFNNTLFFFKSCRLWDNVYKRCWAGQATDKNMAHAHCILGN